MTVKNHKQLCDLKSATDKEIYSENIKYYTNKQLKEVLLLVFRGYVYLLQAGEGNMFQMVIKPVNLLDGVSKIVYSEIKEKYLALKLRDMRKQDNKFDHVILSVNDREVFADFVMEYAEQEEDEIIFEMNEEFSILINSSPQWFSFDDLDRCKRYESSLKQQDLTGFLEVKQNKTISFLKSLFGQSAIWEQKFISMKGRKFFIYKDQNYNKPEQMIDLD